MRRILKRRRDMLHSCRCNQPIQALMLVRDAGNYRIEIIGILDIDASIVEAAFELAGDIALRFPERFSWLVPTVEAVDVATCFYQSFCESQADWEMGVVSRTSTRCMVRCCTSTEADVRPWAPPVTTKTLPSS